MRLEPAAPADFAALVGQQPVARVRAISAWLGDELIGVGGFLTHADGTVWASMAVTDTYRKYPAALWRGAVEAMRMAGRLGIREVRAIADADQPAAARFLDRLGYELIGEISGEPLYRWRLPRA